MDLRRLQRALRRALRDPWFLVGGLDVDRMARQLSGIGCVVSIPLVGMAASSLAAMVVVITVGDCQLAGRHLRFFWPDPQRHGEWIFVPGDFGF